MFFSGPLSLLNQDSPQPGFADLRPEPQLIFAPQQSPIAFDRFHLTC
jgi:hypothetical protein